MAKSGSIFPPLPNTILFFLSNLPLFISKTLPFFEIYGVYALAFLSIAMVPLMKRICSGAHIIVQQYLFLSTFSQVVLVSQDGIPCWIKNRPSLTTRSMRTQNTPSFCSPNSAFWLQDFSRILQTSQDLAL